MQTLPSSLKIGVIRGGPGEDYDTSLLSGAHVLEVLNETHRPIDIFISKDGTWHMQGVEKSPEKILKNVDVVWNGLHGEFGEDGRIQEILNHSGVKYTGSEKYPSAIAMNRWLTKEHLKQIGVKTPTYALVRQTDELKEKAKEIFGSIPSPLIVKPVKGSSALKIKLASTYLELYNALYDVLSEVSDALVEEYVTGKKASAGVIDNFRNNKIYSLPPVEVRYGGEKSKKAEDGDIFDLHSKFKGESEEICPGNFTEKEKRELEALASAVHSHLGLRHYSRSDFIVSPKRGVYFIEVSTLPSMTKKSIMPLAIKSVGASIKDFVHHVLLLAMNI